MAAPGTIGTLPAGIEALLGRIRDNLDGNLGLSDLAQTSGASPFRLHRQFSSTVGETPRRHVERLRLERAAYLLAVTEARVIDIAFDVGFESHEAFARAFRRWFHCSPTTLRRQAKAWQADRLERSRHFEGDGCRLTGAWFETRPPTAMLAIRRLGPYSELNAASTRRPLFDEIKAWAAGRGLRLGEARWGLFPDDPTRTPGPVQCAELCIPIDAPVKGDERVRVLELTGGLYGKIGHIGPGATVGQAYRQLADAIRRERLVFREDPPVQVFFEEEERYEVWFPVRRR